MSKASRPPVKKDETAGRGAAARPAARTPPTDYPELKRLLGLLSPRRLLRAVFVDQLRLRREGAKLKIALSGHGDLSPASPVSAVSAARPAAAAVAATAATAALTEAAEPAQAMKRSLGALLDSRHDSRVVLKHLAALERHLGVQPWPFFHELTLSSLQSMARQLHGLVSQPPAPGVARLLAELADAIEQKSAAMAATLPGVQPISSFLVDDKIEVKELGQSVLEEEFAETLRSSSDELELEPLPKT
ncbi:MAG: hypothetical protein U1F25_02220 [Rubrivivax sp.]